MGIGLGLCCCGGAPCDIGQFVGADASTVFDIELNSFQNHNYNLGPYGFPAFWRHLEFSVFNGTFTVVPLGGFIWRQSLGTGYIVTDGSATEPTTTENAVFWLFMVSNSDFTNVAIQGGFVLGASVPSTPGGMTVGFTFQCLAAEESWIRTLSTPPNLGAYNGNIVSVTQNP